MLLCVAASLHVLLLVVKAPLLMCKILAGKYSYPFSRAIREATPSSKSLNISKYFLLLLQGECSLKTEPFYAFASACNSSPLCNPQGPSHFFARRSLHLEPHPTK